MRRLARLARLRARLHRQAEIDLGRAAREVAQARERIEEIASLPLHVAPSALDVALLQTCEQLGEAARRDEAFAQVRHQQRRVAERSAEMERRKMQTLADRAAELQRRADERREQRAADDRVQARWRRR